MADVSNPETVSKPETADIEEIRSEMLKLHNIFRKKHGSPPMTISKEMNSLAQKWADHLAETQTFEHARSQYGENIFMSLPSGGSLEDCKAAIAAWYDEIQ